MSATQDERGETYAERMRGRWLGVWRLTRAPVLVILGWFTASHLFLGSRWVFLDGVNLLLHEAGHVLFAWGGQTLAILGGTLGQLLWPIVFAIYFGRRRQAFAVVAMVWWFGENLIGVAHYMADAQIMALPLVGGGEIHDWNYLFGHWGVLPRTRAIAGAVRLLGALTMLASLAVLVWWTLRPREGQLRDVT